MLNVPVTTSRFRISALFLGAVAILASAAFGALHWFAVAFGAAVGSIGFVFEHLRCDFPGGWCSTTLAIGGVALAFLDWRYGIAHGVISFYIQYSGMVLLCWGGLMFLVSPRKRTLV